MSWLRRLLGCHCRCVEGIGPQIDALRSQLVEVALWQARLSGRFASLDEFIRKVATRRRPVRFVPTLGRIESVRGPVVPTPQYRGCFPLGGLMMAFEMNTTQQVLVSIQPVDAKGNPAPVDGVPEWLTDNSDVLALEPAADGLSCLIKSVGIPGTASVQVTADADMGEGVTLIQGVSPVTIVAAPAVNIALNFGTPEVQP